MPTCGQLSIRPASALLMGVVLCAPAGCGLDLAGGGDLTQESIFTIWSPPDPSEAARWAADPYDPDKRQRGALLLANAPWGGESVYLRFYRNALTDEDSGVRASACRALALHGQTEDVARLIPLLEDISPTVRREAARALQRLHDPVAVEPLLRASDARNEDDVETRAAAARALGQYAEERAVQGLIASLRDQRLLVNEAALTSLTTLTGQDFGYDAGAWLQWVSETDDVFAGRAPYVYPVYQRSPKVWELVLPGMTPPNERASTPIGFSQSPPRPSAEAQDRGG